MPRAAWRNKPTNRPDWVKFHDIPLNFCAVCSKKGHMADNCRVPLDRQEWDKVLKDHELLRPHQGTGAGATVINEKTLAQVVDKDNDRLDKYGDQLEVTGSTNHPFDIVGVFKNWNDLPQPRNHFASCYHSKKYFLAAYSGN